MMANKLYLKIPEPCHENWDEMTPVEKGRFCGSCQKTVMDFSTMSDREIALFFKQPRTGSVCGMFMHDQLNRDIVIPKKRIPWFKYFFQIALPAMLLSLKANAQGKKGTTDIQKSTSTKASTEKKNSELIVSENVKEDTIFIKNYTTLGIISEHPSEQISRSINGMVSDEEGTPIANASIMLKGTMKGVEADANGWFEIWMESDREKTELVVSAAGFEEKTIVVSRKRYQTTIPIQLTVKPTVNQNVTVVAYTTIRGRVIMGSVSSLTQKRSIGDTLRYWLPTSKPSLSIYPNPLAAGQALTVTIKSKSDQKLRIGIHSIDGRLVYNQVLSAVKGDNQMPIRTDRRWTTGIYMVRVSDEENQELHSAQLIIQ